MESPAGGHKTCGPIAANVQEERPERLVNQLADEVQRHYLLVDESHPPRKRTFTVALKLDSEEYISSERQIETVHHATSAKVANKIPIEHPPHEKRKLEFIGPNTPRFELNVLLRERRLSAPYQLMPSTPPTPNRTNATHRVSVKVGDRQFFGEGRTVKEAKSAAAMDALNNISTWPVNGSGKIDFVVDEDLLQGVTEADPQFGEGIHPACRLARVQQAKGGEDPAYSVLGVGGGPPDGVQVVLRCTLGCMSTNGSGPDEKTAMREAAEAMLQQMGYSRTIEVRPKKNRKADPKFGEGKNPLFQEQKADPKFGEGKNPIFQEQKGDPKFGEGKNPIFQEQNEDPKFGEGKNPIFQEQKADPKFREGKNPTRRLFRIQKSREEIPPVFTLISKRGEPRQEKFTVRCEVGHLCSEGSGPTKKTAKHKAAEAILRQMDFSKSSAADSAPHPKRIVKSGPRYCKGTYYTRRRHKIRRTARKGAKPVSTVTGEFGEPPQIEVPIRGSDQDECSEEKKMNCDNDDILLDVVNFDLPLHQSERKKGGAVDSDTTDICSDSEPKDAEEGFKRKLQREQGRSDQFKEESEVKVSIVNKMDAVGHYSQDEKREGKSMGLAKRMEEDDDDQDAHVFKSDVEVGQLQTARMEEDSAVSRVAREMPCNKEGDNTSNKLEKTISEELEAETIDDRKLKRKSEGDRSEGIFSLEVGERPPNLAREDLKYPDEEIFIVGEKVGKLEMTRMVEDSDPLDEDVVIVGELVGVPQTARTEATNDQNEDVVIVGEMTRALQTARMAEASIDQDEDVIIVGKKMGNHQTVRIMEDSKDPDKANGIVGEMAGELQTAQIKGYSVKSPAVIEKPINDRQDEKPVDNEMKGMSFDKLDAETIDGLKSKRKVDGDQSDDVIFSEVGESLAKRIKEDHDKGVINESEDVGEQLSERMDEDSKYVVNGAENVALQMTARVEEDELCEKPSSELFGKVVDNTLEKLKFVELDAKITPDMKLKRKAKSEQSDEVFFSEMGERLAKQMKEDYDKGVINEGENVGEQLAERMEKNLLEDVVNGAENEGVQMGPRVEEDEPGKKPSSDLLQKVVENKLEIIYFDERDRKTTCDLNLKRKTDGEQSDSVFFPEVGERLAERMKEDHFKGVINEGENVGERLAERMDKNLVEDVANGAENAGVQMAPLLEIDGPGDKPLSDLLEKVVDNKTEKMKFDELDAKTTEDMKLEMDAEVKRSSNITRKEKNKKRLKAKGRTVQRKNQSNKSCVPIDGVNNNVPLNPTI